jgi:hypothetical protein
MGKHKHHKIKPLLQKKRYVFLIILLRHFVASCLKRTLPSRGEKEILDELSTLVYFRALRHLRAISGKGIFKPFCSC